MDMTAVTVHAFSGHLYGPKMLQVILRDTLIWGPVSEVKRYGHLSFCYLRSKVTDKVKDILDISKLH